MPYTIVQHSGFGYKSDPTFSKGLEMREVTTKADVDKVNTAGGVLFATYAEADDFCDRAMYVGESSSLVPNAKGTFSDQEIDGLRIYIPIREVTVVG